MKDTKIIKSENNQEINWDLAQWLISKDKKFIILTTGNHENGSFEGTCLPCHIHPKGHFHDVWGKEHFEPLLQDLTIVIGN